MMTNVLNISVAYIKTIYTLYIHNIIPDAVHNFYRSSHIDLDRHLILAV